jgi:hypothetical protein
MAKVQNCFEIAADRLARYLKLEPIVAFVLAAWKNLAQARAGERN